MHQVVARLGQGADDVVAVFVAGGFPFLTAGIGNGRDRNLGAVDRLAGFVGHLPLNSARLGEGRHRKDHDGQRHQHVGQRPPAEFSGKHINPPHTKSSLHL